MSRPLGVGSGGIYDNEQKKGRLEQEISRT